MDPTPGKRFMETINDADVQRRSHDPETENRVREGFHDAVEKLKGRASGLWDDLHDAYRMVFDSGFDLATPTRVAVLGALAYAVSPIDVLPDWVPWLGFADDVAVLTAAITFARPEIERYRAFRAARDAKGEPKPGARD